MKFIQNQSFPKVLIAVLGATFIFGGSTGCASLLTPVTHQELVPVAVTPITTQTNVVTQTVATIVTNGVTLTNVVTVTNPVTVTTYQTNWQSVTVTNGYTVAAGFTNALNGIGTVNSLTAPINPYSGILNGILGLAAGGAAWYARLKTTQLQAHQSATATIVTAIEGLGPAAQAVKDAVSDQSVKMGTADKVNSIVQAVTKNMPGA